MIEIVSYNMPRVKFVRNLQVKFLIDVKKTSSLSWIDLAKKLGVYKRTLFDWRRAKYTISEKAFKECLKLVKNKCDIPKYEILPDFWSVIKAGKKGGSVVVQKYGNPGTPEGREKGGLISQQKRRLHPELYQHCNLRKNIQYPRRSAKLVEFVGILMGDGGITDHQVTVTLDRDVDREYIGYVANLFKILFGIETSIRNNKRDKSCNIVASSKNLVEYLVRLGLKRGNKIKQGLDIPKWILKNRQYRIACLRGLMDTDGCVFTHRYKVNDKIYSYKKMSFSSHSISLLNSVKKIFLDLNFTPKIRDQHIWLYNETETKRYFKEIGPSNPKHIKRFKS